MAVGRAEKWMLSVVAVAGLDVSALIGEAQAPSPNTKPRPAVVVPAPPATPEQVTQWVEELDSDQFVTREIATARLIIAGNSAISPILDGIAGGTLETATRGIHILRELALSTDPALEDAARLGLEKIASAKLTSAARRAAVTLDTLNETRQKRAIDELERLGAKLGTGHVQIGMQVESVFTIEIGPDWRGEEQDLRRLKWLVGVRHVKFSGVRVTDSWLKFLAGMQNLTTLTLKRTSVSDNGFVSIRDMSKLQSIWIMYCPVGDGVVDHLKTLKHASMIKLYGTKITKDAVKDLQQTLEGAKIDYRKGGFLGVNCQAHPLGCEVIVVQSNTSAMDAGLEASDVILKYGERRVESFETLTSHISDNSPGDEIKLEIIRNVKLRQHGVERAADAKLGMTGKSNTLGIEILTVAPNSFVAQLELLPGDVITACGETRVLDMQALEAAFAAAKPGARLDFNYVRGAMLLTKIAKLGEWE